MYNIYVGNRSTLPSLSGLQGDIINISLNEHITKSKYFIQLRLCMKGNTSKRFLIH